MIVTLNSENPADALLIDRLFAPKDAVTKAPIQKELPGLELCGPATVPAPTCAPDSTIVVETPPPAVDSTGLPWDARIHSESKATVADGSWRKRRGVDPELVKQVEAELRGDAQPAADTPAAPASIPTPPPPAPVTSDNTNAAILQPPAPPAPEPAPAGKTLADLSAAVAQGKVDILQMIELAKQHGCADIPSLSNNPLALAAVIAHFDGLGAL